MSNLRQKGPMTRKIRYIEANNGTIVPTVSGTLFTKGQRNILQEYANQYNKNHPVIHNNVEEDLDPVAPVALVAPPFWKKWTGETKSLFNPISPRKKRNKRDRRTTRKTRKTRKNRKNRK
jgi:hypothetical protein